MTLTERKYYANRRIESALENYEAARMLNEKKFYNSAMSRLYYAVFYAVNALLMFNGYSPKTHSATRSLFSQHFIKTKEFDIKYSKLLAEFYDNRQKGDYDAVYTFSQKDIDSLFPAAKQMIDEIEKYVSDQMKNS